MLVYNGPLGILEMKKKDNPVALTAYRRWLKQRERCSNKNLKGYKNYGDKNIRVVYSSRDFVSWYLNEIESFKLKHPGECPDVGRIDHNKNYEFGNIKLETRSSNSSERNTRCGNSFGETPVTLASVKLDSGFVTEYSSAREAERETGVCRKLITRHVRNQVKYYTKRSKYAFVSL